MPLEEGEFTVGVLSFPDGYLVGSIALKRLFNAKLSVLVKSEIGLISSGYSQGLIDDFPEVQATAERIAHLLGSVGPINVQGRLIDGCFLPFEINPRFSASTYLRALAGFNEVDIYLHYLATGSYSLAGSIRYGYYLRSLSETFVEKDSLHS
jgi:carbamoyl-phosphate synthase large subunit